jgi:phage host-nuclease inhibitor protein Gam
VDSIAPSTPPPEHHSTSAAAIPLPARKRAARAQNLAIPFLIALLCGAFLVVTIPSPFPPLFAMVLYLLYGLGTSRREGVLIEFTDSFYYLGFSLTLVALTHGLGAFVGVPKVDQAVLVTFGQALLTTVLGVIGRISVQLFYRTAQEGIERTNQEVERISRELIDELQRATERVATGVSTTAATIENELPRSVDALVANIRTAVQHVHQVAEAAADLATPVTALATTAASARDAFSTLRTAVATSEQQVRNDAERLGTLIERTHADVTQRASTAVDLLVEALSSARTELSKVATIGPVLNDFTGSVQAARSEIANLTSTVDVVGRAVNDTVAQSELPRSVKALTKNVKSAVDNVHQVATAAAGLVDPVKALAERVAAAQDAFVSLRSTAADAGGDVRGEAVRFGSSLEATQTDAASRASAAVTELVHALSMARTELSQVGAVGPMLNGFGNSIDSARHEVAKLTSLVDEVGEVVTKRISRL